MTTDPWAGAACRRPNTNPDWWFPVERTKRTRDTEAAITACSGCPLRERCARAALSGGEQSGIWGGVNLGEFDTRTGRRNALRHIAGTDDDEEFAPSAPLPDPFVENYAFLRASGVPHPQIAARLGMSADTFHQRVHRLGLTRILEDDEQAAQDRMDRYIVTGESFTMSDIIFDANRIDTGRIYNTVVHPAIRAGRVRVVGTVRRKGESQVYAGVTAEAVSA